MKKKIIAVILTIVLALSLSATALAAKGPSGAPAATSGSNADKGNQLALRARINTCLSTMTQNRAMMLNGTEANTQLGSQLRTMLQVMKENGTSLSEETLAALTVMKTQLQTKYDEMAATKGSVEALMVTYRAYKQAGDLENAAAVLDQVIAIQQTRLQIKTEIGSLLQQTIDLLSAV